MGHHKNETIRAAKQIFDILAEREKGKNEGKKEYKNGRIFV